MKASFGIKKEKVSMKDLKEQKRDLLDQIDNWILFLKSNLKEGELPKIFPSKSFVVKGLTAEYKFLYDNDIQLTLDSFKKKVKRLYPVKLSWAKDMSKEDTKFYDKFQTEYYSYYKNGHHTMQRRMDGDYEVNYKV